jgi:hypothetical protein
LIAAYTLNKTLAIRTTRMMKKMSICAKRNINRCLSSKKKNKSMGAMTTMRRRSEMIYKKSMEELYSKHNLKKMKHRIIMAGAGEI